MANQNSASYTWSPQLAYVIGLIATDGNLSKDGRHFAFRSIDKQLIETFKHCLKLKNKIATTYKNKKFSSYRIQFGNVKFYHWLRSIGLHPSKTYSIGSLKIPQKFFRDFLRGHLDGDGNIYSYLDTYNIYKGKKYKNTRIYVRFISASEKHIRWLHWMIKRCAMVTGALLQREPTGNRVRMWEIKFSKYESLKLFRWLYYQPNLPTLLRKRSIAENLLNRIKNNKLIR